jgi:NAD(P)-dependent dehydrogenase (short-subunit alcohol dehydrogenase family)
MLKGKVAVITGASSGIGAALALRLGAEGATVVLAARRRDRLEEVAQRVRLQYNSPALAVPCDVADPAQAEDMVERAVREFGRIDILVNDAGSGHFARVEETDNGVIGRIFSVNVFALWYTTRPALRQMKEQRSGHIINVASMAGKLGYAFNSAYVAAKHACVGFTHALRQELVETGIHATVICPAGVATDWASVTDGGSMLPFFEAAEPIIRKIAGERHLPLPQVEGVIPPDRIAAAIVEAIYHPVPEVYTHAGSKELVVIAAQDPEGAERLRLAVTLGEREAYEQLSERNPKAGLSNRRAGKGGG